MNEERHDFAVEKLLPLLAKVATAEEILAMVQGVPGTGQRHDGGDRLSDE